MTREAIHSRRTLFLVLQVLALTLMLSMSRLVSTPAAAQEPGEPAPVNTGYLYVYVIDSLTGLPIGGRQISIYNNDSDLVTQATTTCRGYVDFDGLPSGAYRVDLDTDPNWITRRRYHVPGGRNTPAEWVWVRPGTRVGVRFYELPSVPGAGLRVYAFDSNSRQANQPRQPLPGAAFTVYDPAGNAVANGTTGCGGFIDFNNLAPGTYRVAIADQLAGTYLYPPSGERWVPLNLGVLTSVWFFTVPSAGPQTPPTPVP